jgi:phosphate transport system substrate-binding protein
MNGEGPPGEEDPERAFSSEAAAAGIVLPRKARANPWDAIVIVVALIVISAGIGEITGWVNFHSPKTTGNGGFESQSCTGSPVQTYGTVSSALDTPFASWLNTSAEQMDQAVGGCFHVNVNSTPGDGYAPPLGGPRSEFAATYTPPSTAETRTLASPIVLVPVALSAVGVVYNIPGAPTGLNLTSSILAGMYLGTITSWNDPAIVALNPTAALAGAPPIRTFHHSGESVANQVFTEYLASGSLAWNASVGAGLSVTWPGGIGTTTDSAMTAQVSSTPGAIGYFEMFGPAPSGIGNAQLEDAAGDFAPASAVSTWVAADSLAGAPAVIAGDWSNFSLVGASASGS